MNGCCNSRPGPDFGQIEVSNALSIQVILRYTRTMLLFDDKWDEHDCLHSSLGYRLLSFDKTRLKQPADGDTKREWSFGALLRGWILL